MPRNLSDGLELVRRSTKLAAVNLDGVSILTQKWVTSSPDAVTTIDLSRKHLCVNSAMVLSVLLTRNATLRLLQLSGNRIGALGTERLAVALRTNSTLTALDLTENSIAGEDGDDNAGVSMLAAMLGVNSTLQALNLRDNKLQPAARCQQSRTGSNV